MTSKSQTKLLKLVCKRAELLRAPYRVSSWATKISQKDKKSSIIKQTQKKIPSIKSSTVKCRENMVSKSEGMYY
jgi:hypothetical protein